MSKLNIYGIPYTNFVFISVLLLTTFALLVSYRKQLMKWLSQGQDGTTGYENEFMMGVFFVFVIFSLVVGVCSKSENYVPLLGIKDIPVRGVINSKENFKPIETRTTHVFGGKEWLCNDDPDDLLTVGCGATDYSDKRDQAIATIQENLNKCDDHGLVLRNRDSLLIRDQVSGMCPSCIN